MWSESGELLGCNWSVVEVLLLDFVVEGLLWSVVMGVFMDVVMGVVERLL